MEGHHEVGADQTAAGCDQAAEKSSRNRERWVGDDPEGSTGQPKIGGVGTHDSDHPAPKSGAQVLGTLGMQLERHNLRSGGNEMGRDHASAGTNVEHEVSPSNAGSGDEATGVAVSELVPSPVWPPCRGHGTPWSSSWRKSRRAGDTAPPGPRYDP